MQPQVFCSVASGKNIMNQMFPFRDLNAMIFIHLIVTFHDKITKVFKIN